MSSSCFDCLNLQYHPNPDLRDFRWWCGAYDRELFYNVARAPNDCPLKRKDDTVNVLVFPQANSLLDLYNLCIETAEYLERPFTINELFYRSEFFNKNSLWILLDKLVVAGLIEKVDGEIENTSGKHFTTKLYFPIQWGEQSGNNAGASDITRQESA